jgi:hypothetical protein
VDPCGHQKTGCLAFGALAHELAKRGQPAGRDSGEFVDEVRPVASSTAGSMPNACVPSPGTGTTARQRRARRAPCGARIASTQSLAFAAAFVDETALR